MSQNHPTHLRSFVCIQGLPSWILLLMACLPTSVFGQQELDQSLLERIGLKTAWFTSADLGADAKIVDWMLNVNRTKATSYIRLAAGPYSEVISENDLDGYGKPLGLDGLVEFAEFRKEVLTAELKSRRQNQEVKLEQYTLPKSSIYVLGSNARLTSLDADSGRQNWTVAFGSLSQANIGVHADDNYVAAVNGSTLYCFEAATGKFMWSHSCRFAVEAPPAVTAGKIFVPLLDGRLEVFEIAKEGFGSTTVVASGVPSSRPLVTSRVVGWATNLGHLNFTGLEERLGTTLIYRLKAGGRISNTPTFRDELIFSACEDGFVYAIREATGQMEWQSSVGTPITQSPFLFGDRVYVISDDRRMFCLDARTGAMKWDRPVGGIGTYFGMSRERIYLTDGFRGMLAVDPISGRVLSRNEVGTINFVLHNDSTDRLYVASNAGVIYCIHEANHPAPYFHPDKLETVVATAKAKKSEDASAADASDDSPKTEDPKGEDPFQSEDDANPKAMDDEKDPFSFEDDDPKPADQDATSGGDGDPFSTEGDDPKSGDDKDPKSGDDNDPFSTDGGDSEPSDDNDPFGGN